MTVEPVLMLPPWGRAVGDKPLPADWACVDPKERQASATEANASRNTPTKPSANASGDVCDALLLRQAWPLAALPADAVCSPTATRVPRR